jgi:hypothetical protein
MIGSVEKLANQLTDLGEDVITKILCMLPPHFRLMLCEEQTIDSLTLQLLIEESKDHKQGMVDKDGELAFFSSHS